MPQKVRVAIEKFFLCNSVEEEFRCFIRNYKALKKCKFFVYSDTEGAEFPECFKTNYDNDFAIIEIGCSDRYYVIDAETCKDILLNKESGYFLDMCVELDTQVISYLKNMFISMDKINIPDSKKELFYYLSGATVNFSSLPYLIENARKITEDNFEECYLNLKSYELFKNFDFRLYMERNVKSFRIDEVNMQTNIDNTFHNIQSEVFYNHMKDFYDMQENNYCLLLKAVIIENSYSKRSAENKMKLLVEFINNTLGIFCEREMIICYYYFMHHKDTEKFFKKTKANSKNIKNTINGMAWDLTHIRLIERWYDFTILGNVKFGIHPFLTYDNGLKDILKLCPVRKMAIYDGYTIPFLKTSFIEIFPEARELIWNSDVTEKRKNVFINRNIELIQRELEEEAESMGMEL